MPFASTLCWKCSKASGRNGWCNWSKNLKPVDGWKAIETSVQRQGPYARDIDFLVIDCPEYVSDIEYNKILKLKEKENETNTRL